MKLPLQISFRRMERSPALEATIIDRATRLDTFASQIMSCRVVVEPAGRHRAQGEQYEVRIDITLPGGELVATREPGAHAEYKEIFVAIRDAFDSARRQLEEFVRCQRGDVKHVSATPHAKVSKLVPDRDFGFFTTPEGRDIYFHRNSVLNDAFDQLVVGTEVAFVEEEGEKASGQHRASRRSPRPSLKRGHRCSPTVSLSRLHRLPG